MTKVWQKLYDEAMSVLNSREISPRMWCGSVASALITKKGNIYKGICVDTDSSLGMCAERNAISTMLTYGECEIDKILSVYRDGKIFFHGAKSGHKLDALRRDPRASFCVVTQDHVIPQQYTTDYRSVIAFGLLREVTDEAEKREALRALALKYAPTDTEEHREKYIGADIPAAAVLELTVVHLSGKSRSKV